VGRADKKRDFWLLIEWGGGRPRADVSRWWRPLDSPCVCLFVCLFVRACERSSPFDGRRNPVRPVTRLLLLRRRRSLLLLLLRGDRLVGLDELRGGGRRRRVVALEEDPELVLQSPRAIVQPHEDPPEFLQPLPVAWGEGVLGGGVLDDDRSLRDVIQPEGRRTQAGW